MKTKLILLTAAFGLVSASANANLLITQFYEGSSFDKWIEVTNTGGSSIDLTSTSFYLSLWSNAATENWKTNGNSPNSSLLIDDGVSASLASGDSLLFSHTSAASPGYATADLTSGSTINFNGDDSVVLYNSNGGGSTWNTTDILDAVSFTDAGSEGANTSVYRTSTGTGYNTTTGSTFEDFPSVWSEASNAAVDSASPTDEFYLGYSSVAIPEPSMVALLLIGFLGIMRTLRARK